MSFARRIATRSYRQLSAARLPATRRTYASASETAHKASETAKKGLQSDLPWLITAVAVTVPGTYYILSNGNVKAEHGHPGEAHHGSHDDEETHEEAPEEEQPSEDEDASERPKDGENRTESNQPPTGETQDGGMEKKGMAGSQPEGQKAKSENEGKNAPGEPGDDEQISEKSVSGSGKFGETQELENEHEGKEGLDKRIHKPDAKGGAKRRIESRMGKDLGQEEMIEGEDNSATESAAPSKESEPGKMSSKQAGLSNTNTKHSTDIGNDPGKSKKPDGSPETAKMQGTVDPTRPAK